MVTVSSYDREQKVSCALQGMTTGLPGLGLVFLCSLLSLCLWTSGQTQPGITMDEIPSRSGLESHYSVVAGGSLAVDVGSVGGPQMWDYSQVSETDTADTVVERIVDVGDTPFESFFPEANLVHETNALSLIGAGTTSGYQYWTLDEASLSLLGMGADSLFGIPVAFAFHSPLTSIPLPLELGARWSDGTTFIDTFHIENPVPEQLPGDSVDVKIEVEYTREGEVDGWGTVAVPCGEYEALRVRRHDITHFDLSIWIFFRFTSVFDTTVAVYTHDWFVENLGSVLTITSRPDETDSLFSVATNVRRLIWTNALEMQAGDVNCDGRITPGDALCAFWRSILGSFQDECLCPTSEAAAEINCDGAITPGDALCIFWRAIEGEWRPDCQCGSGIKIAGVSEGYVDVEHDTDAGTVKARIVLRNVEELDAFGFHMTYPSHLLQFQSISSTRSTDTWTVLDGALVKSGVIGIGGFHTEGLSSNGPIAIAEVTFSIRAGANGQGEIRLVNLVDDLVEAEVKKGDVHLELHPLKYALFQNFPNPFNPDTDIRYQIAGSGLPVHTTIRVYNVLGQEVRTLIDRYCEPGCYIVTWDARDNMGYEVTSGIYYSNLRSGDFVSTKKMILMR